ncbi:MAG: hypothetical protein R6U58_05790 [Bacteroidales bacterium]
MEKTELEFPHKGETLTAIYPFFGPANLKSLQAEIRRKNFSEPTFPELTSFVHHYFNGKDSQAKEVDEIMYTKYFAAFTEILYLPRKNEVCFLDHPDLEGGSFVDAEYLLSRLRLNEVRTRVSLENVETGSVPWNRMAKNPLFIAVSGGEEGAEKLAELASKHSDKKGHIFVPKMSNFSSPQARIPLLYSYDKGRSLTVTLNGSGYGINSYTFGLI